MTFQGCAGSSRARPNGSGWLRWAVFAGALLCACDEDTSSTVNENSALEAGAPVTVNVAPALSNDDSSASDSAVSEDDTASNGGGGVGSSDTLVVDNNGGTGGTNDQPTVDDGTLSTPPDVDMTSAGGRGPLTDPTQPTDCGVQTLTLARSGTTSSCGFELPDVDINTFYLNVYIAPQLLDRRPVCRVGDGGSCTDGRGWFENGGEVALCDETCGQFHDYPEGFLIAEYGCASTFCRDSCGTLGGSCAPAQDCCPGLSCEPDTGTCVSCIATGDSCDEGSAGLCCSEHCSEGSCCYDFGQPCAYDSECCAGACVNAACGCAEPQMLCNGTCIDVATDAENCGACGMVCGEGGTCVGGECVCDEASPSLAYCDGSCVDTSADAMHCGGCTTLCRADQECQTGNCGCAAGLVECDLICVDTTSSSEHCGGCGGQCSSLEVCAGGACVCRPDRLLCDGACIDPLSDNLNCGECGQACNGQRRCMAGECQ